MGVDADTREPKYTEALIIKARGRYFGIDSQGRIRGSDTWKFLGVSTHHWHTHIVYTFEEIWNNPKLAIGGYVWDLDHGTTRLWGGSYMGKIPRITECYKSKLETL